jgi:hypothetical protein
MPDALAVTLDIRDDTTRVITIDARADGRSDTRAAPGRR